MSAESATDPAAASSSGARPPAGQDAALLRELVDLLGVETCAVPPRVMTLERAVRPPMRERLAGLDELARAACSLGVHSLPMEYAADGTPQLAVGDNGVLRAGGAWFLGRDFRQQSVSGRSIRATDATCGDTECGDAELVIVTQRGVGVVAELDAAAADATLGPADEWGGRGAAVVLSGPGVHRLWVTAGEGAAYTVRLRSGGQGGSAAGYRWRPGDVLSIPVHVGAELFSPDLVGFPGCPGSLPPSPSFTVLVDSEGWAEIGADAVGGGDAVIAVSGPSGVVGCNDDYNGLNPGIYLDLTPGLYAVWVGAYSMGSALEVNAYVR
ncbi:MAG: hypothetical protein H6700_08045 [Myxococcales bacterium]|nr:hypothetical protein [Myxococcales bacterium]